MTVLVFVFGVGVGAALTVLLIAVAAWAKGDQTASGPSRAGQCAAAFVPTSRMRCVAVADPRCAGGNCTAHCREYCGGRCGKAVLGVVRGGIVQSR